MKDKNRIHEANRIISPILLLSDNKIDIEILFKTIAKKYRISVKEAATALSKTLENIV